MKNHSCPRGQSTAQAESLQAFSPEGRGSWVALEPKPRFSPATGEGARAEEIPSSATPASADANPPTARAPEVHGEDPPRPSAS